MKDYILENRKLNDFNNPISTNKNELIIKTENIQLSLRKREYDGFFAEKRGLLNLKDLPEINISQLLIPSNKLIDVDIFFQKFDLNVLIPLIFSKETSLMKYGLTLLRRFISNKNTNLKDYTDYIVENNDLINRICSLLNYSDQSVKYESVWLLTNLTVHTNKTAFILTENDNFNIIYDCFIHSEKTLLDTVLWLMGNIISDVIEIRNELVKRNFLEHIADTMNNTKTSYIIKERIIWVLCNFFRKNDFSFNAGEIITPVIEFFKTIEKEDNLKYALFVIFNISQSNNNSIQACIDNDLFTTLKKIINKKYSENIYIYTIKIIGNLLCGTDTQCQYLINQGVVDVIRNLLENNNKPKILKEVIWSCSNLTAGTLSQVEKIFKSGIFDKLMEIIILYINQNNELLIQQIIKEAYYALVHGITGSLKMVKIGLLDSKYNVLEILVNGLRLYPDNLKLLALIIFSIKGYVDLQEENPMIDYSIINNLMNFGLLDELYKLVDNSGPLTEKIEELIDELESFKI